MYACLHAAGNLAALVECAREFSPYFEELSTDSVVVDLRGLRLLFGSPVDIAQAMTNRAGMAVNLAVADDPDTAILAARGRQGITIIPSGQEGGSLASLPIYLLPCSPESAAILDAWGIRTLGEFAALPPQGIAARLGSEGTHLQRLARGSGNRQLRPVAKPLTFERELELESALELLEPLSFLLGRVLGDLCSVLEANSLGTDEITLSLTLENALRHCCTLRLPTPMRDPKVCLKLLQLELNAHPPSAPILKIHLRLNPVEPRTEQHSLFVAVSPQAEKLEITLSKLSHLCGAENVGTPEVLDTHRPDAFQINRFTVRTRRRGLTPVPTHPALALRRFRPPKYVHVITQGEQPQQVSSQTVRGNVVVCAGPWRTSGDWWEAESFDCDEWDIALTDGALYRLREDRRVRRWFLEGVYD